MYIHNECVLVFKSVAEPPLRSGGNRVQTLLQEWLQKMCGVYL